MSFSVIMAKITKVSIICFTQKPAKSLKHPRNRVEAVREVIDGGAGDDPVDFGQARWVTFENGWLFGKLGVVFWVIVAFCPALSCSFLTRQIALGTVTKLHNPVVTTGII